MATSRLLRIFLTLICSSAGCMAIDILSLMETKIESPLWIDDNCDCYAGRYECNCCMTAQSYKGCIELKLNISTQELHVKVTINGDVMFSGQTEAKAPQDVCGHIEIPMYGTGEICVQFYRVTPYKKNYSACLKLRIRVSAVTRHVDVGCIHMTPGTPDLQPEEDPLRMDPEFTPLYGWLRGVYQKRQRRMWFR